MEFVKKNKTLIAVGTGLLAAAAASVYFLSK